MNADQRDRAAQLAAFYNGTPAAIARRLGLPFSDVAVAFDSVQFTDLVKRHENRLIAHAIEHLYELNVPAQEVQRRLKEGAHGQKVTLARDLCVRLPHNRRFPD